MTWSGTFSHIDPGVIRTSAEAGSDIYPYAQYKPIPEAATQRAIVPWSFILHTMAGPRSTDPDDLWRYVNRTDVVGESHLILGYDDQVGEHNMYQVVPFTVAAHNNYKANEWVSPDTGVRYGAISVETQDNGVNTNVEDDPWTQYQLEHLAGVSAFLNIRYGIPLVRTPSWDGRGVDGHRKFQQWSIYVGKTCPGQARWEQIPLVLDMAQAIVERSAQPPKDGTMPGMNVVKIRFDGFAEQLVCWRASLDTLDTLGIRSNPVVVLPAPDPARKAVIEQALGHPLTAL